VPIQLARCWFPGLLKYKYIFFQIKNTRKQFYETASLVVFFKFWCACFVCFMFYVVILYVSLCCQIRRNKDTHINKTANLFFKLKSAFLLISNHNSFRVLFHKIASVYFLFEKIYIYILATQGTSTVPIVQLWYLPSMSVLMFVVLLCCWSSKWSLTSLTLRATITLD